jgi:hypothetical protein
MMYQMLNQWKGNHVEIVTINTTVNVAMTDHDMWQLDTMNCLSGLG